MILCSDPAQQYQAHKSAIKNAIERVIESGWFILGPEVTNFEKAFAAHCDVNHAVGVASGTDALVLALKAMDVGVGDEVITVSHTALATVSAVVISGATPILVDIDPVYYTIDPEAVERAITPRTKAIIAVHLYGQAADLDTLGKIAKTNGLRLIEDCAQSSGGLYRGKRLGSIGDAGTFSFYPTKNLGAIGDGGAVVTNDAAIAERIAKLRQYGWDAKRETVEPGINSRLDPLQAAILGAKLPQLDDDNAKRIALGGRYERGLKGLPIVLPAVRPDSRHVYHLYVVAVENRDALRSYLRENGIDTGIHYPVPGHRHGGYAKIVRVAEGGLPVTDAMVTRILSLPMYPELDPGDADRVIAAIRAYYGV